MLETRCDARGVVFCESRNGSRVGLDAVRLLRHGQGNGTTLALQPRDCALQLPWRGARNVLRGRFGCGSGAGHVVTLRCPRGSRQPGFGCCSQRVARRSMKARSSPILPEALSLLSSDA